jgi:hypothetical protein
VLVLALLLSLSLCRAQTVPSEVTFTFGTTNDGTQLWDLTGTYGVNMTVTTKNGLQVPVTLGFSILQDADGNLRSVPGDLQGVALNDIALVGVNDKVSGKVTGSGGSAEAKFVVHFSGSASIGEFQNVRFSAVLIVDATPNSVDGQLDAVSVKFSARFGGNFEGVDGTVEPANFFCPLPSGVDGSWTLDIQMLGGNSLAGSATVTTGVGHVFGFKVSGPVNAGNAIAKLRGVRGGIVTQNISSGSSKITIASDVTFDDFLLDANLMGQKLVGIPPP